MKFSNLAKSSSVARKPKDGAWMINVKLMTDDGTWYMEEGLTIFDAMIRNVAGRLKK